MEIVVKFDSLKEVREFSKAFVNEGCNCLDKEVKKDTKVKPTKKEEPKQEETKPIEDPKKEVKSIGETEEEVTINKDDVIKAFKLKMKEGKNAELKNILSSVGASKISEIEEKDYEKVLKEVEAL